MAKTIPNPVPILLLVITFYISTLGFIKTQTFSKISSPSSLGLNQEKLTHLHFYFHDMYGRNPTAVKVAEAAQTNTSKTYFGSVFVMDDPLTLLPDVTSKRIGYAQGMTVSASQNELGLLMIFHFVFTEGEYNGSTISILGRNLVFSDIREMPVVGGSGVFRFARGYAEGKTHSLDVKTGNAVLEYNVFVLHP
ncbi:PREDICTED: dirigent protein 22-like [Camelina sativa]|uniref:Dirigent protein n=1 Tax=Camelina sativa TaxID=90675 RepID=A0ABM0WAK7_CAMSA|nr:PREDICTED: dirigent protein 22-like [Camelina sativa]